MLAFIRDVSPRLAECELQHVGRAPIDVALARRQHAGYRAILGELGVTAVRAPALPGQPDGVFVEDTAIVLPEVAVMARPGAASRSGEVESVVAALKSYRRLQHMAGPGTLDGGDVMRIGRTLFVGESQRTNAAGIQELKAIVEPLAYRLHTVAVTRCMHLKTACTFVHPHFVVANKDWVDAAMFAAFVIIPVDASEPFGANTLTVAGTTLVSAAAPKTELRLRDAGIATRAVEISEFEKAEGGLTCLSLLVEQD